MTFGNDTNMCGTLSCGMDSAMCHTRDLTCGNFFNLKKMKKIH